ncbi:MAG: SseB family protein [Ruminococcus sp.]|nr:SseB family protein [Ruminococcus sp.]
MPDNNQPKQQRVVIDNAKLIEAIGEMRAEFSAEHQNKVINLALRSTFLVPGIMEKKTELVADQDNHVEFQDKQAVKFVLLNHSTRGKFFPAFTDREQFDKLKDHNAEGRPFAMKFSDLAGLTENTPDVEGFVINPFDQNLPFTKEMLASIKATLIKAKQERDAAAAAAAEAADGAVDTAAPNITVSTNEE